jgi:hypothetical protein
MFGSLVLRIQDDRLSTETQWTSCLKHLYIFFDYKIEEDKCVGEIRNKYRVFYHKTRRHLSMSVCLESHLHLTQMTFNGI